MTQRKWSEGPWSHRSETLKRDLDGEYCYFDILDVNGKVICEILTDHVGQQEANAHLITTSTELYEVLSEWDESGACGCDTATCKDTCLPARTRRVLAKAVGEDR